MTRYEAMPHKSCMPYRKKEKYNSSLDSKLKASTYCLLFTVYCLLLKNCSMRLKCSSEAQNLMKVDSSASSESSLERLCV